jgi:hypothetical protein
MRTLCTLLAGAVLAAPASGQNTDHQRVGVAAQVEHRWEAVLSAELVPWGPSTWELEVSPQMSYEYNQVWGATVAVPYRWNAQPTRPWWERQWGDAAVSFHWAGAGEPKVHAEVTWSGQPWTDSAPRPPAVGARVSFSQIRDPVIWGAGLSLAAPLSVRAPWLSSGWSGGFQFSYQEVANDAWVWSLALSPRWSVAPVWSRPVRPWTWAASLTWTLAWYELPWAFVGATTASSDRPWAVSASGSRTW